MITKGHKETFGRQMFSILIVMMFSQVYSYVQIYCIIYAVDSMSFLPQ